MPATLRARYTTDDASDTTPTWIDGSTLVRSFSISRGRDSELSRVEAGTATLLLDNRTRTFDPTFNSLIRPMNRWWLEDTVTGESLFFGYAKSYTMGWPTPGGRGDAFCTVQLVDEFQVLALDRLPAMDPPVDTYADVVLSDEPQGYWRFGNEQSNAMMAPTAGNTSLAVFSGVFGSTATPIVGDFEGGTVQLARSHTGYLATASDVFTPALERNEPGDVQGLSSFTFETWFKSSEATPAADRYIVQGPYSTDGTQQWQLQLSTTGKIKGVARNSGATAYTATGATSISADVWYHIAIVVNGTNTLVYLNGVQDGSASWTGVFEALDLTSYLQFGDSSVPGGTRSWDEPAFYRYAVPAARLLAHYTAGVNRGFAAQDPGARITSVLTAAGNTAATSIRAGTREMIPAFMHGQSPLEELRKAEDADSVDAVLFIAKDGTITFLDDGHRSVSPWNTVQATYDDDGTDLEYVDIAVDYSDSFIANDIQVTRQYGNTVTSTDSTSVSRYLTRPLQLPSLPITTDSDVTAIGTALLAKYKDPMTRITSLTVTTTKQAVATATLGLELGDRIRVFRTQPTGGRIDQTLFVQRIQIDATPGAPWRITLGVSPL